VSTQTYPGDSLATNSPFALTPTTGRVDMREDGKIFYMTLAASVVGESFRLGIPRLDVQPAGVRL